MADAVSKRSDLLGTFGASFLLCGFSIQTTAIFLANYRPIQMDPAAVTMTVTSSSSAIFSIVLACLFVVLGLGSRWVERLVCRPWFLVLVAVGFVGASWGSGAIQSNMPLSLAADLLARFCSAFLLVGWLVLFARRKTEEVLRALPLIMAVGLLMIFVAVAVGPARRVVAMMLFAAGAVVWLIVAQHCTGAGLAGEVREGLCPGSVPDGASGAAEADGRFTRAALVRVCGTALVLSCLLGVLCALPHVDGAQPTTGPYFLFFLLAMAVALLVLSYTPLFHRGETPGRDTILFCVLFPLGIVVLFLMLYLGLRPPLDPLSNAIGRMSMELSLLVSFLLAARHFEVSVVKTFAFGQAAFLLGNLAGVSMGLWLPSALRLPSDHMLVAAVVILLLACEVVFVLVLLWQISRRIALRAASSVEGAAESEVDAGQRAVEEFSREFGLSEKEQEVLTLTVRGRSRQRVAEALYVSLGSVNTYFHRIYQKVGVHSRQELLDKLEEFRR